MTVEQFVAESPNLSLAWTQVLLTLLEPGTQMLSPVLVTVSDFGADGTPAEVPEVRARLDAELQAVGKRSIHTIANTIFPESLWRLGRVDDPHDLYTRYERLWSRIRRDTANGRGVYFQRLIAFRPANDPNGAPVNQLQRMIDIYRSGNRRRSVLQAGVFDPTCDHRNTPYLGFPCLQQIVFTPIGSTDLAITGFYATQYHLEKAYGNYLGLCRLGRFVASQLERRLVRMTCVASVVTKGSFSKRAIAGLTRDLRMAIANHHNERSPA